MPVILHVTVQKPLWHCFDYLLPEGINISQACPGMRIQVPFGHRQLVGVILRVDEHPCIPLDKIKPASVILDQKPLFSHQFITFCEWAANYYHYPLGEILVGCMPKVLRTVKKGGRRAIAKQWRLTPSGAELPLETLNKAPKRKALLSLLTNHTEGLSTPELATQGFSANLIQAVMDKGWIEPHTIELKNPTETDFLTSSEDVLDGAVLIPSPLTLNTAQCTAIERITLGSGFHCHVLAGVTGSGKTEVYIQAIAHFVQQGKQALVLVPEIGLTPQTIARFQARFQTTIEVLHSGIMGSERLSTWLQAKIGAARILIGTRSAIFTPLPRLGIIVIDEEHDLSFKQQTGFKYSARDLAITRARLEKIPVILGSATPSLETLHNVAQDRYQLLSLPHRAGNAMTPSCHVIDLRQHPMQQGLSTVLLQAIKKHITAGNQVLLFLNRRGYAPAMVCHQCGWIAHCQRCDAKLTLHLHPERLICHHCLGVYSMPKQCGTCHKSELLFLGQGTEQLEQTLKKQFPLTPIVRIDRDTIRHTQQLEKVCQPIYEGTSHILIGTQMLTKGHHFPDVTLVGIIDVDQALYSADFRATERMGQLIIQVSGRAGRAEKPGEVYLQTHHPDHPLLQTLLERGYFEFADHLLQQRAATLWPPFTYLALFRAEAQDANSATRFLNIIRTFAHQNCGEGIHCLGPIPALMERKAGRFRALLLVQAKQRSVLHRELKRMLAHVGTLKIVKQLRWSLDVDPQETI